MGFLLSCCLSWGPQYKPGEIQRKCTYLSQGMMFVRSNTMPVPSELRAHTGWENGWNESAQQSKGVTAAGWGPWFFLRND